MSQLKFGSGLDAIIFGATDREAVADPATGVRLPTLLFGVAGFPQGITTADVSGLGNFCTVEADPPGINFWCGSAPPPPGTSSSPCG